MCLDIICGLLSEKNKYQYMRILLPVSLLVFLAIVVGGIVLSGLPHTVREEKIDERRIWAMQEAQWMILDYYRERDMLPESLEDVPPLLSGVYYGERRVPLDPVTNEPVEYEKTGERTFELCGTFFRASAGWESGNGGYIGPKVPTREYGPEFLPHSWEHPAGEYCFERTIRES